MRLYILTALVSAIFSFLVLPCEPEAELVGQKLPNQSCLLAEVVQAELAGANEGGAEEQETVSRDWSLEKMAIAFETRGMLPLLTPCHFRAAMLKHLEVAVR